MNDKSNYRVAIIGAGLAGLTCAQKLRSHSLEVEIFEKSNVVGGRMATREIIDEFSAHQFFDHGAQYFTARSDTFKTTVENWVKEGSAALWTGVVGSITKGLLVPENQSHERFVGVPHMRSIVEDMTRDVNINLGHTVVKLQKENQKWTFNFAEHASKSNFDLVVIALPPAQTATLLGTLDQTSDSNDLKIECEKVVLTPCWAVMVSFSEKINLEFDGLFVNQSSISWVCRDSSKPQRAPGERFVIHASASWSLEHISDSPEKVSQLLTSDFFEAIRATKQTPSLVASKLWRFAAPEENSKAHENEKEAKRELVSKDLTLAICGDWCHGARVEGAFSSGLATAVKIIAALDAP